MKRLFFCLLLACSLSSCTKGVIALTTSRIHKEKDEIKNTTRFQQDFYFLQVKEFDTPLNSLQMQVFKEQSANGSSVTVYDELNLGINSQEPEKNVYFIFDEGYEKITIKNMESHYQQSLSENRKDILTKDSTKVSVVTGYSQNSWKTVQCEYALTPEVIDQIERSGTLKVRYYVGPHMLTIPFSKSKLKKLKKLLEITA